MTSLIFGTTYLLHKGIIEHRREKKRVKNYERWEGLRDEYDEQRKISRETRSLDIQRTGVWDPSTGSFLEPQQTGYPYDTDRPILTLRDQQEANDARTSWRPQESWDEPRTQAQVSMLTGQPAYQPQPLQPQYTARPSPLPMKSQKTGATWDEALPAPLQVSRRSFDDYDYARYGQARSGGVSRVPSTASSRASYQSAGSRDSADFARQSMSQVRTPSQLRNAETSVVTPGVEEVSQGGYDWLLNGETQTQTQKTPVADVSAVPGGRMAELIERGY